MDEQEFLGRGIKFPIQVNQATGRFVLSEGKESVKESVYIILMTQKTERFASPEFGSRIFSYTFMDTSLTRINMMARELEQTILAQEPRISQVEVTVEPRLEQGCLIVNVGYEIAALNAVDNLVFPFYLHAESEGENIGSTEER